MRPRARHVGWVTLAFLAIAAARLLFGSDLLGR